MDVCSGSVMPFDLVAVNIILVKRQSFALAELQFVPWKGPV